MKEGLKRRGRKKKKERSNFDNLSNYKLKFVKLPLART